MRSINFTDDMCDSNCQRFQTTMYLQYMYFQNLEFIKKLCISLYDDRSYVNYRYVNTQVWII